MPGHANFEEIETEEGLNLVVVFVRAAVVFPFAKALSGAQELLVGGTRTVWRYSAR